ncbi:uncharacterized protein UMAG_01958 [Mycosarcoma maydis]|uniref:Uncharacterized protein n=1 Tax=Mycosarcoma maydis TaxID=5270 RepID=A0A0D1CC93_MYCMD|nr:uncharacterized protein UMAG_01958 [Ustilago maydis 521]KIS70807.1 hypothetical protein UMAG_01958 [Ustilago maydis 521]|eukprot:XP_011387876.1 hypothetical protein UMAG_01958 [Ustilago maydis 521]
MEEIWRMSSSSSPSRHFSSFHPLPNSRRSSKMFGFSLKHGPRSNGLDDEYHHPVVINGIESTPTSQHPSPWASRVPSPSSTPCSSIAHGDLGNESPPVSRTPEKKRSSWLGSMPASYFTPHRAPASPSENFSLPPVVTRAGRRPHSRANSSSSSSSKSMVAPTLDHHREKAKADTVDSARSNAEVESMIPNVQFLGLMLLLILLISSPLIKVLSVLLFVALVVLDDS